MKKLLLAVAGLMLFMLPHSGKASHLLGGEITWKCLNNGNYIFTLTLYRDCRQGTSDLGTSTTIQNSGGSSISVSTNNPGGGIFEVSPTCYSNDPLYDISCGGSRVGAVEKFVYTSNQVTLSGTPPASGWIFSWNSCCRPNSIRNLSPAEDSYYLRAIMYPYTPTAATGPISAASCYDSSPIFAEDGSPVICTGYNFIYNHLAADQDLDSLYFNWATPLATGMTDPVNWVSGFSNSAPYPDQSEHSNNGSITLDGVSGEVNMNVQNLGTLSEGSFASCIKIEAWRNCQLIAEVYRDVAIFLLTGCPANQQPTAIIDTTTYPTIKRIGNTYRTKIYPTDTLQFDLKAQDFDFLPSGVPQTICFEAAGLQVSSPLSSGTGCLGDGTCAKFTPVFPQTSFCQGLQNEITFFWAPDCGHLGSKGRGCGSVTSTYYFTLKMKDNACPAPSVAITTLIVDVVPGDPSPPPFTSICKDPATGDIDLFWNEAEQDSGLKFNYYAVLGSQNIGGPYDTLAKIPGINSLSHHIPTGSGYKHFYLLKSTGACDFLSDPSDTLSVIEMDLTASPPVSSEYASLSWTPLHVPLPSSSTGFYEVWIEAPYGSGNWNFVGQTDQTNFTYKDTVQVCQQSVRYQIRVTDTVNGWQSCSGSVEFNKQDSATFSDKTNTDIMAFNYVTVSTNGLAELNWNTNNISKDVTEFLVLFNDPVNGWQIIQSLPATTPMPFEWASSMASSRSEQFKVISVDSCGNQSDEQKVIAHNTIYLKDRINKCDGTASFGWNLYKGFKEEQIGGYQLVATLDDGTGPGAPQLLYSGGTADTSFTQTSFQSGYEYCYTVQVLDTNGALISTSNEICVEPDVVKKLRIVYMAEVTNNPDRGSIDIKAFVDGDADVENFDVERSTEEFGIYQRIGNVAMPRQPPYVFSFSDYAVNNTENYYYRLVANNVCGGRDTTSNIGRNVVLNIRPNANLTNTLYWTPYEDWAGKVDRYDIYRSVNDNTEFELVGSTQVGDDTTFTDDISDFGMESGKFCYYVVGVEGPHPLGLVDDDGTPFSSRSNEVCRSQRARVYVPTAFRPGSEIQENQTFGPSMRFEEISEYNFYILNRWGKVVFQTDDPAEQWDGKEEGNPAPTGVYVYYLKYSTVDDVAMEERGTFTLVN